MKPRSVSEDEMIDIGKTFNTSKGQETLKVLDRTFYKQMSYVSNSPSDTAFNEGCRYVVALFHNAVSAVKHIELEGKE